MAKISLEFDTVTKEVSLTADGKKMENVSSVYLSTSYDDRNTGFIEIVSIEEVEDDKLYKTTRITANEEESNISRTSKAQVDLQNDLQSTIEKTLGVK